MTIRELELKICADRRMDRVPVVIGDRPCYDDAFNLIRQADGKWVTFYGERGFPYDKKEYDTEEEATDAFWAILEEAVRPYDWRKARANMRAYRKEEARRKKQRRQEWRRKLRDRVKAGAKDQQ